MPFYRLLPVRTPQGAQRGRRAIFDHFEFARFGQSAGAPRRGAALAVAALLAARAILAGCAVPGEPTVRHPLTPEPVTDLVARQQGNAVVLNFTLPAKSTEQKPLTMLPTVDVYRTAAAAPPATPGAA